MTSDSPIFADALSTAPEGGAAEREVLETLRSGLRGHTPSLLTVFATHHHGGTLEGLGARLARATGAPVVLGCTGESVIGARREVEGQAALSVWAAHLPRTRVAPFECSAAPAAEGGVAFRGGPELPLAPQASLLVLGDPFSFPMDLYLEHLAEHAPGVPAVGGMASGGSGPGQCQLLTAEGVRHDGMVGAVLEGGIEVRSVVSQGCRPVGTPWVITRGHDNVIERLGGRKAGEVLLDTLRGLPADDAELFRRGPFVGLAIDARKREFERGDFLVRGLLGIDERTASFAVGDRVRSGQTVQFLVRDAESAGEDLLALMDRQGGGALAAGHPPRSAGALLFSCNGRGLRMFDEPDHDVSRVRAGLAADVPVAGFFAAGEVGPVGGRNFLHGFTASVAVFRERAQEPERREPAEA